MKITFGKRVLMIIHWACSLLSTLVLASCIFFPSVLSGIYNNMRSALGNAGGIIVAIVLLIIYLLIAAAQIYIILQRRPGNERGFVTMNSDDDNQVRLSAQALEQMVRKSVYNVEGITDLKIDIDDNEGPVNIHVDASILNGCHIPTLTNNIKNAVRKFVEADCGVPVRSIKISIRSVAADDQVIKNRHTPFGKRTAKAALQGAIPAPTIEALNNVSDINLPDPETEEQPLQDDVSDTVAAIEDGTWEAPEEAYAPQTYVDESSVQDEASVQDAEEETGYADPVPEESVDQGLDSEEIDDSQQFQWPDAQSADDSTDETEPEAEKVD